MSERGVQAPVNGQKRGPGQMSVGIVSMRRIQYEACVAAEARSSSAKS